MANAIALHIVVTPPGGVSPSQGALETLHAARTALANAGWTVYTDGAAADYVAIPDNEANPSAFD